MRPVLQVRVDVPLIRELRDRAKVEGVSVGDLARRFLREGLDRPSPARVVDEEAGEDEIVITKDGAEKRR